jgi:Kdo2-lipid IVA lauroyltransferase/acyltransferase
LKAQLMATTRRPAFNFAVFCLLRTVAAVLQALPLMAGYAVAKRMANLLFLFDRRHREVAKENLRHAFGEQLSPEQRSRMTLAVYEHFCKVIIEILHLPRRFRLSTTKRHLEFRNMGRGVRETLRGDRPVILVGGHHGNWEVSGVFLAATDLRTFAIARDLDNPWLQDFVLRLRSYTGQTILSKNGDFERIREVLEANQVLAMLADQSAGPRGYFVDFFGRSASTHRAIALFALEYDAPVIVAYSHRIGPGFRYEVGAQASFDPRDYRNFADGAQRLTADFTAAIEAAILRAPEQYFWLHNRWKHQPPVKKKKLAA